MSVNSLSIKTIKQMPVVLGEVDVIKSITLLPGVTNAGEDHQVLMYEVARPIKNLIY